MVDGKTVLVVEDDSTLRGLVAEVLVGEGYAVLEAGRGQQALHLAQEHEPDLVLADQGLPEMSGLELLDRLRAHPSTSRIPLVLVTGLPPEIHDPRPAGVLAKPFDLEVLLLHVKQALASTEPSPTAGS